FDAVTVSLLPKFGISMICDGHFRSPHLCQRNMFWIPQQLFSFRPAPAGVWTVCYHHNQWRPAEVSQFQQDLDDYGPDISSVDEVVAGWGRRRSRWSSFLCRSPRLSPLLIRGHLKLVGWRRARSAAVPSATRSSVGLPTK